MTTLILYVKNHELYRQEVEFPISKKRLDRHGRIDWRKAHIDGEVEKIKVMFYRQISKYYYEIILEVSSKMNRCEY